MCRLKGPTSQDRPILERIQRTTESLEPNRDHVSRITIESIAREALQGSHAAVVVLSSGSLSITRVVAEGRPQQKVQRFIVLDRLRLLLVKKQVRCWFRGRGRGFFSVLDFIIADGHDVFNGRRWSYVNQVQFIGQ